MFDSPLHFCPVVQQHVELDQGRADCTRNHGCVPLGACPLARYFQPPAVQAAVAQARAAEAAATIPGAGL